MMLFKALILALTCACAYAALQVANDDGDCALYLTGPGRSSAYDYSINLLKGNFGYDGQHTCITYDAINQAYLEARQRILVAQPKGEWKPEDYASVGELVLDISINIARRYGLTYEEIEKGLPLVDTSRTLIREVCPPVFSHVECRAGKYRRLDGLCNNLRHPTWGSTNAPFQRLLSPLFSDGINSPRISHTGRDLPLSRVVSRTMHPDDGFHDHAGTVMVIAWGQFMDHDYTLTGTPLDPINRNDPEECCKRPPHLKHPYCNEIRIPDDDYFYRLFGVKCIDFVRGFPSPRPGCRLGSRTPFNTLTGTIDGNTVYGVTEKFARKLRTGYGGILRMNPVFKEYGLKDLLPLKLDIPDEGCTRPNKNMYCFEAGEIRVNEQLVLTVMHTLMAREHNRVALGLAAVNPHWDDETLYQEARRINIAEIQQITYNEFLPILLGKDVMEKFGLVLEKNGYWDGYDQEVNPDVLASFAAAAYRFGHSLLPTAVERWSKAHKFIASKRLSDLIRRPYDLYRAGVLDEYVMGLMNQVAQAMDDSITQEVTNHLFKKVGARFGMDLVSFNMQRGREFGLPGYMEFRKFCGLPGAETFQDLFGSMPNQTVQKYESIFEHPIDVDLWSGGVSERPLPGSMLGPTFACIIATQFSYSRRGDRFWFELPNQPSSFTPEQLVEVRKARLARVICDNTDIIDTVQLYPMVLPDHELNPRVPCRSGIMPSMDFSKWAEPAPFHNVNAKEFITDAFVSMNVNKSNATNEIETKLNLTESENSVLRNNISCNCNETITTNENAHSQCTNTTAGGISANCFNSTLVNNTDEVKNNTSESESYNNDTILKYVYKKNETSDPIKPKGHYKNSLKRRKRSSTDSALAQSAPLIVNYETSHAHTPVKDREQWRPQKFTKNIIKSSDLADFNIETLHDSVDDKKIQSNNSKPSENVDHEREHSGEVSGDKSENKNTNKASSEESGQINESREVPNSNERELDTDDNSHENIKEKNISNESDQNDDRSTESNGSEIDNDNNSKNNNYKFTKAQSEESFENSEEPRENKNLHGYHNSSPPQLQNVDLDDFSYERIQLNKDGKVETAKDDHDNKDVEIIPTTKPQSSVKTHDETNEAPGGSSDSSSDEANEPTHINDGEVKPVVEINPESESIESDEEISSLNKSLETITGVNEDSNEKLQSEKSQDVDHPHSVKDQFERVPINYNHKNQNPGKTEESEDQNQHSEHKDDEGTVDNLTPKRYDEHLNIKFDDIDIKLPELKLPEDIFTYPYEDPPTYKNNEKKEPEKKQNFFHYNSEEDSAETPEPSDTNDDDESDHHNEADKDYYGYYDNSKKHQSYKKPRKEDEEEDDDPYEKFVRERFGKRRTFEKRSEKIRDGAYDPQLHKQVQNILEKTKKVKEEAAKSGDPNAEYMWTLEYGQKL